MAAGQGTAAGLGTAADKGTAAGPGNAVGPGMVAGLGTAAGMGMDAEKKGMTVGCFFCGLGKVAAGLGRAPALVGLEMAAALSVIRKAAQWGKAIVR